MKLYHGSKNEINFLERRQAGKSEDIEVPQNELLNAIYLTPNYGFALACAVRPEGKTNIDHENKKIAFEYPKFFKPDQDVFIYEIDSENIPKENIEIGEDEQYIIKNMDKLEFTNKFVHKAGEIEKFYELTKWEEKPKEVSSEINMR